MLNRILAGILLFAVAVFATAVGAANEKPNILVIMGDECNPSPAPS